MTIGLNLLHVFARELQISTDLVFSEQAYYAAESGVEKSLVMLKDSPVEFIEDFVIDMGNGSRTLLNVKNLVDNFDFVLSPLGNTKFQLLKDIEPLPGTDLYPVGEWDTKVEYLGVPPVIPAKVWEWKILCTKYVSGSQKTVSISGDNGVGDFIGFSGQDGKKIDENGIIAPNTLVSDFFAELSPADQQTCFFSATNLDDSFALKFTFQNISKMAPERVNIISTGTAGSRVKTIAFDYAQKNLGTLFDFVLFHSESN